MDRTCAETAYLAEERRRGLLAEAERARRAAPRSLTAPHHSIAPRRSLAAACYRLAAWLDERYVAAQGAALAGRARFDLA